MLSLGKVCLFIFMRLKLGNLCLGTNKLHCFPKAGFLQIATMISLASCHRVVIVIFLSQLATKQEPPGEEKISNEEWPLSNCPMGKAVGYFYGFKLMSDTQPTVGRSVSRQVGLGYRRKLTASQRKQANK